MTVWLAALQCDPPALPEGAQPDGAPKPVGDCLTQGTLLTKASRTPVPPGRTLTAANLCDIIHGTWLNVGATPITVGCIDFGFLTVDKARDFVVFNSYDNNTPLTITGITAEGQTSGISVSVSVGDVIQPWSDLTIQVQGASDGDPVVNGAFVISFDDGSAVRICVKGLRILSLRQGKQSRVLALADPTISERFVFDLSELVSDADTHQRILQTYDPTFEVEQRLGAQYPFATKLINQINGKGNFPWVVALHNWPMKHNGLNAGESTITLSGHWPREIKEGDFVSTYGGESYSIKSISISGDTATVSIDPPILADIPASECVYPAALMNLVSADWKHHHGKYAEFRLKYRRDHANWLQRTEPKAGWQLLDGFAVFPFISDGLEPVGGQSVINADNWRFPGSSEVWRIQAQPRDVLSVALLLHGIDEINEFKDWMEYHRTKYRPFWIRRPERYYTEEIAYQNATELPIAPNFEASIFFTGGVEYVRVRLADGTRFISAVVGLTETGIQIADPLPADAAPGACIEPIALMRQVGNSIKIDYRRTDVAIVRFKITVER